MNPFEKNNQELLQLISEWEEILLNSSARVISQKRNKQNRTVKQIVGHMVDSASNNIHRIVHLQYQESPLVFPNYATNGNNDRWIAIQNYQDEHWFNLVKLWKYTHLHFVHVVKNINPDKLGNEWLASETESVSLQEMVIDFSRHLKLHISEIEELLQQK
ncbi:MAG TPA: hypothetical protein VKA27_09855 [Sunxiuqinia sp.]|nr:hypothetical protein [Sunxiuqinia sp.]